MQSENGSTRDWHGIVSPGDTTEHPMLEDATCFRCGDDGSMVEDLDPFSLRRCNECAQHFVSPRLNGVGRSALYGTREYFDGHVYGNTVARHLQRQWIRGRLDLIEDHRGTSSGSLLEVGCGYGNFIEAAQERGWRVRGVEFSPVAAAEAAARTGADVVTGEIEDVEANVEFDVLCAWDVIEHVPKPGLWAKEARRLVADGGLLALSLPYYDSLPARVLGKRWGSLKPHKHIWHFTTDDVSRLLAEVGFRRTEIITNPIRDANRWRLDSMVVLADG